METDNRGVKVYSARSSAPGAKFWMLLLLFIVVAGAAAAAVALWPRGQPQVVTLPLETHTDNPAGGQNQQTELAALKTKVEQLSQALAALRFQMNNLEGTTRRAADVYYVANGGFEETEGERLTFWMFETWDSPVPPDPHKPLYAIDSEVKHGGNQSLRYETGKDHFTHLRHRQLLPVEPRHKYFLKGWIKTQDVTSNHEQNDGGAHLRVKVGAQGVYFTKPIYKTADWQEVSVEFATQDMHGVEIYTELGHYGNFTTGTAWFDDVKLEPLQTGEDAGRKGF
ncbi:MAG: hypothetical protein ABSE73_10825 [Planctomycetota bacterium]